MNYVLNKDRINAWRRAWYQKNKERIRIRNRKWKQKFKEEHLEIERQKHNMYQRRIRERNKNRPEWKRKKSEWQKKWYYKVRKDPVRWAAFLKKRRDLTAKKHETPAARD